MSDMKLIMENWRATLNENAPGPCNTRKAIDLIAAVDIAMNKLDRKQAQQKYSKYGLTSLNVAFSLAGALGEYGLLGAIGTVASGGSAAVAAIIGGLFVFTVRTLRKDPGSAAQGALKELFIMFCVDPKLLEVLDNKIEEAFLKSDRFKNMINYTKRLVQFDPDAPMPDFNRALSAFLDDYMKAGAAQRTTIKDIGPSS